MLNGRLTDAIAFDLFYAVKGQDDDTYSRPIPAAPGDEGPKASWGNIIGAFVGINAIENLGLSIGYTANFNAYEAGSYREADPTGTADTNPVKTQPVTYTAPFYSGIDIRLSYSGIDKIGLTFNNNISLAGVKGNKIEAAVYNKEYLYGFGEQDPLGEGQSEDWFHWNSELKVSLSLVENLGLTLHLGNQLGMTTSVDDQPAIGTTAASKTTRTITDNEFRVSLFADYGIGAANIGIGLFLSINSSAVDFERTGSSSTTTFKGSTDVTTFGIPVMFKVAF
jgi:hypothetical protein